MKLHLNISSSFSWSTSVSLNSNHLPILISILDSIPPVRPQRSFINFKLAKWSDFKKECERLFGLGPPPRSCDSGEKVFRRIL